ncbi:MAG: hypothetical protein ACK4IT_09015 [Thioalkalivibrionaceae bacterium]
MRHWMSRLAGRCSAVGDRDAVVAVRVDRIWWASEGGTAMVSLDSARLTVMGLSASRDSAPSDDIGDRGVPGDTSARAPVHSLAETFADGLGATAGLDRNGLSRDRPDRYAVGRGHWHRIESCALTIIESRVARAGERAGFLPGWHRRNLEISVGSACVSSSAALLNLDGRRVKALTGRLLAIGDVRLRLVKPRPPCGWLDKVSGRGAARLLGWDAGWCVEVATPGRIHVERNTEDVIAS